MKTTTTKILSSFILILFGMFSTIISDAQGWVYPSCTCLPDNPHGYCYTDKQGKTRCHKYHNNNAGGNNDGGNACICVMAHKGTGTDETSDGIYPNPLINSTVIHVTLPETQKISLKIFDLNGRLVSILANDSFEAGEHQMEWNATNVNAGIYLLRLQTSSSIQTRKLIVVK